MGTIGDESEIREFYEAEAGHYDADRWAHAAGAETDRVQAEIAEALLRAAPPGLFLELGVGTGRFATALAHPERPCLGLDISRAMLRETATRAERAGKGPALRLVQASGLALPFANASLGACASFNVFSHLPNAEATLEELARVLRPGGLLALNFPNALSPYLPYALSVRLTGRSLRKGVHTRWYDPFEIRRILDHAGFSVEDAYGQIHYPWARGTLVRRMLGKADALVRRGALAWTGSIVFVLARRR